MQSSCVELTQDLECQVEQLLTSPGRPGEIDEDFGGPELGEIGDVVDYLL